MTLAGRLASLGFADAAAAQRLITGGLATGRRADDDELLRALAAAADPDAALAGLARLAAADQHSDGLLDALHGDQALRARLIAVLGASPALGDHLARHPADWRALAGPQEEQPAAAQLRAALLTAVGADPDAAEPSADPARLAGRQDPVTALRPAYRRALLQLAARDLTGAATVDEATAELSDLAAAALEAALAIARSRLPPGSPPCRLAVIAMGKCGARELNYASDVDVIFVAAPPAVGGGGSSGITVDAALRTATQLAAGLIRVCSQSTPEGALFPVDPNLRPEGRQGPLVRTLASHLAYYERWAKTWEFQALLKARPVAGDLALGQEYLAAITPLVWQAAQRDNFVADVQAMRRRVLDTLPAAQAGRQIKLGPGGLRDIEFAVQLLQLVHGRADETLREPATLPALAALAAGGYVGRHDAASLAAAYRFLRRVEHLLQLHQMRRTHLLPEDPAALRRIGRAMALASGPQPGDPADALLAAWREHAAQVRQLHEKLFYRPLLDAVARLPGDAARLTPAAARARLEALGYANPAGALRHIQALTGGVSRRAAIQRTLLPVLLGWFADAAEPDAGLLAFRKVSDALGDSPWYLRLLRDDAAVAQRMARLLASSRYATQLLLRAPDSVAMLGDTAQLAARPADALAAEAAAITGRYDRPEAAAAALLALRRRELLRTASASLLGQATLEDTGEALTTVTTVTISAALDIAVRRAEERGGPLPTRLCVLAMGRFGGHETSFASDADVMFVHEPQPGADEQAATKAAHAVAEDLRALLARPGADPSLIVDPDLRPEGRQGPLVRTLASYRAYYGRWSAPWEAQALLRAEPAAGDAEVGRAFTAMADEIRYPAGGIGEAAVREIRRIKARVEAERMPRGMDPALHLKLGPGGLADVEWVVQLLQLRHGHAVAELRTTRTLTALAAAAGAGLVSSEDAAVLREAWRLAARIRDAVMLVRGRPSDALPAERAELAAVARLLGYRPDAA
ncbi:MAG TPA: bifunctional [glutamine synthetase] adenylyltransferase/[glutamine synthetase]-adenylyl-L-tyrosine phosphorylase, partial [Streptosporangiaceae bacterium]